MTLTDHAPASSTADRAIGTPLPLTPALHNPPNQSPSQCGLAGRSLALQPSVQENPEVMLHAAGKATSTDGKVLSFPPSPLVAQNEVKNEVENSPENRTIKPPPLSHEKASTKEGREKRNKRRRKSPFPVVKNIASKPKADGSVNVVFTPNGRYGEKVHLGRVGKRKLAEWVRTYGKAKAQLKLVYLAWIEQKKREKGI